MKAPDKVVQALAEATIFLEPFLVVTKDSSIDLCRILVRGQGWYRAGFEEGDPPGAGRTWAGGGRSTRGFRLVGVVSRRGRGGDGRREWFHGKLQLVPMKLGGKAGNLGENWLFSHHGARRDIKSRRNGWVVSGNEWVVFRKGCAGGWKRGVRVVGK